MDDTLFYIAGGALIVVALILSLDRDAEREVPLRKPADDRRYRRLPARRRHRRRGRRARPARAEEPARRRQQGGRRRPGRRGHRQPGQRRHAPSRRRPTRVGAAAPATPPAADRASTAARSSSRPAAAAATRSPSSAPTRRERSGRTSTPSSPARTMPSSGNRSSIPSAFVEKGYPDGTMPTNYGDQLIARAARRARRLPVEDRRQLSPRQRFGGATLSAMETPGSDAVKRFHVTTFGCQMNEHDSERMKGMLASLGYAEASSREEADLILFNTCSIRESADSRFIAHLGEAKRLKGEQPDVVVGVGGCWAQSVKDEVFERFPFVDVAFGPGQIHRLAEFLTSDSLSAQGYFEFEDFAGHLPSHRGRPFQAWVQISQGCNCACSYCIVPSTRGREASRPAPELLAEVRGLAADGVREVTLLGQNVNSYGRDLRGDGRPQLRRAARRYRRDRRDRADPLHEPAPEGHEGGRDPRPRRVRRRLRAHPPAAAVGVEPDPEGDAPHLRPRALPRPGRADPRAPAGRRPDHRHHRRLPGRDRAGLRGDARGRRGGRLRRRVHLRLQPAPRHRGGRARRDRSPSGQEGADGPSRRGRPAARPRARRAVRRAGPWRSSSRARAGPIRAVSAAAAATTRRSTSRAPRAPGSSSRSRSASATSQTLLGAEVLLSRAR